MPGITLRASFAPDWQTKTMACSLLSIRIIVSGSGHAAGASSGVVFQGGGNGAAHGNGHNK